MATTFTGHQIPVASRRERHPFVMILRHVDVALIGATVVLALIGVVMVYSATRSQYGHYYLERQAIWVVLGTLVMVAVMLVDYRRLATWGYPIYGLVVLSLLGVFVAGKSAVDTFGAQRWYQFGPLQLQPSEFAALGLIIAIATYCSRRQAVLRWQEMGGILGLAAVSLVLVYKQPDLGTTIILGVCLAAMMVAANVRARYLALLSIVVVGGFAAAIKLHVLDHYQLDRLTNFLHQNADLRGGNYDLYLSKATISSGGLHGTGLLRGTSTNLAYVPNQQTDFIFSAIGEQLGFVGAALVIGLFGIVSLRILRAAQTARDSFGRLLCAGAFAFLAFSVFENIGMTIGLMPITGIPLPFISYGGSASFAFFATVGLVANVEMRRVSRQ